MQTCYTGFDSLPAEYREIVVAIRDYRRAQAARDAATATDDIQERQRVLNAARDRLGARLDTWNFVAGVDCFLWDGVRWGWDRKFKELFWVDTRPRERRYPATVQGIRGEPRAKRLVPRKGADL